MTRKIEKGNKIQTIARINGKIIVMLTLEEYPSYYRLDEWDGEEKKTIVERKYEKKYYTKALSDYDLLQEIILNTKSFDNITEDITKSYRLVRIEEKDAD